MRADEIIQSTLKTNRTSYNFLTLCGTNMFYDLSNKVLTTSNLPCLVCMKVGHSGSPWALGTGSQDNRVPVQIDIYALQHVQKTVSDVKYYDTHLLKEIASDIFSCLRAKIYDTAGVLRYTELSDRAMPVSEMNTMPLVRRTLEVELEMRDAE
jgi:hypothetical protein